VLVVQLTEYGGRGMTGTSFRGTSQGLRRSAARSSGNRRGLEVLSLFWSYPAHPDPVENPMIIGVPKEVKNNEFRVAITASGVHEFTAHGHTVLVERGAGVGSTITDAEYEAAGAEIVDAADDVWARADMVLKVKEPVAAEYHRFRRGVILFN
jgi:hypothetical protein